MIMNRELANHIEKKIINEKYSPDAVIGEIQARGINLRRVSVQRRYNYIDKEVFANITNKDLPVNDSP